MKLLGSYLRRQRRLLWLLALAVAAFAAVFSLYELPVEAVAYAGVLCVLMGGVLFALGYWRYVRRHEELVRLTQCAAQTVLTLPPPADALEADYQALLEAVSRERTWRAEQSEEQRREMLDYYTLWAHQIKTPIAAMDLLLQKDAPDRAALAAELLKVEEYVEMVLGYLRLGSETTDLVLQRYPLDQVVRGCLRRYARLFILKKITLRFQETGRSVLSDEKWLGFVIGQLLSNALKYTPEGGTIRIYGDGETLVVADSGIGIREEDLPRVFEKGFTGCNGRSDQRSSGIGLYLCRKVTDKLGHSLALTSRPGQGTMARLTLPQGDQVAE